MNRSSEEKEEEVEADCGEQRRFMMKVRCFTGLIMSEVLSL